MARRRWKIQDIQSVVSGENPFTQFGYHVQEPKRKLDERWVDAKGKVWEQRSGYKAIVNEKADAIRDLVRQNCSKCHIDLRWGTQLDKRFFPKTGMCYNCTIDHDTKMRMDGTWDVYEKRKVLKNQLAYIQDMRNYIKESIDYLTTTDGKMSFVDEKGKLETWTNTQIDILLSGAKMDYEKLTQDIVATENLIASLGEEKEVNGQ